jgi:hypothetical protein
LGCIGLCWGDWRRMVWPFCVHCCALSPGFRAVFRGLFLPLLGGVDVHCVWFLWLAGFHSAWLLVLPGCNVVTAFWCSLSLPLSPSPSLPLSLCLCLWLSLSLSVSLSLSRCLFSPSLSGCLSHFQSGVTGVTVEVGWIFGMVVLSPKW